MIIHIPTFVLWMLAGAACVPIGIALFQLIMGLVFWIIWRGMGGR